MIELFVYLLLTLGIPLGLLLMMLVSDDSQLIVWIKKVYFKTKNNIREKPLNTHNP